MSTLQIELFSKKQSGLDGLRREDFPSEEAFIEAGIERQMRLNNPAYQKARIAVMEEREKQLKEEAARLFLPLPCGLRPPDFWRDGKP